MTDIDKLYTELDEAYSTAEDALVAVVGLLDVILEITGVSAPEPEAAQVHANLIEICRRRKHAQEMRRLYGLRN